VRHCDAQQALGLAVLDLHGIGAVAQHAEAAGRIFEEHQSLLGRGDAVRGAAQKLRAELVFEPGQFAADRRLGHPHRLRGARKAFEFDDFVEHQKVAGLDHGADPTANAAIAPAPCVPLWATLCCTVRGFRVTRAQ
jgi:hypothetical protein